MFSYSVKINEKCQNALSELMERSTTSSYQIVSEMFKITNKEKQVRT